MRWTPTLLIILAAALFSSGCDDDDSTEETWQWDLPQGFPTPSAPDDNPMSADKVELGRHLFYDTRLSANETFSCATCHQQDLAFTDGLALASGSTGQEHPRNTMSLTNVGYNSSFNWANPLVHSLEEQALTPIFGEDPVELGLTEVEDTWLIRFSDDALYQNLFQRAFPEREEPFTLESVVQALGAFQRTLISGNSPYDRYIYQGQEDAMSESARRGMDLFFSETMECFHCHGGFNFSNDVDHENTVFAEPSFHNTGLYNYDHVGSYPPENTGLLEFTGDQQDMGKFRAPTLRNIELTAPYMHDGSVETLDDVIDHYAAGGRTLHDGPWPGNGSENPFKSTLVSGFNITASEAEDLKAFLHSLTDEDFVTNPDLADPF